MSVSVGLISSKSNIGYMDASMPALAGLTAPWHKSGMMAPTLAGSSLPMGIKSIVTPTLAEPQYQEGVSRIE